MAGELTDLPLSEQARAVIAGAEDEARRWRHGYVGTEHLLLSLISQSDNIEILNGLGIDRNEIRRQVDKLICAGNATPSGASPSKTPQALKVIAVAVAEARQLGATAVHTEHLLLGLLREELGVAAQVFLNLGIELKAVQALARQRTPGSIRGLSSESVAAIAGNMQRSSRRHDPREEVYRQDYDRFSTSAIKVMQLANQEAQRFNHEHVATVHVLLGLMKLGRSAAADVLKNLDIDLHKIRREVEKHMQGRDMVTMGRLPLTPRAKKTAQRALREAEQLGCHSVATEHLLLALLSEREGLAAQILIKLGIDLVDVRRQLLAGAREGP